MKTNYSVIHVELLTVRVMSVDLNLDDTERNKVKDEIHQI